jgi:predicted DsbA family dithiol-disulfide isomerase
MKLDILSDPVCPWCYIGQAHLNRALEAAAGHPFVIEWHPFQLNPEMPAAGVDRAAYLEQKFGGRAEAAAIYARIDEAAAAAGLEIDWAAIRRMPNTLDAHRLIHWAGIEGRQSAVVSALFRGYFREGRDIGDAATLAEIAAGCGMDRAATARLLAGDADREEILARDAHARSRGVTGVPTFVLANAHVLVGAQPPEVWGRVLDEIARLDGEAPQ